MKKRMIPIYFDDRQERMLRRLAAEQETSLSEIVRRGINLLFEKLPVAKDPALQIIDLGSSKLSNVAERHDEYLVEEIMKKKKSR